MNRAISTVFAALAVAALAAAPAFAFKLEGGSGGGGGSSSAVADENSPFYGPKKYDTDKYSGDGVYKWGSGQVRINGSQSNPEADYRIGIERMFNPLGRPGQ